MQRNSYHPDLALELGIFAKTFRRSSVDEVFDAIAGHGLTCTQWNWACVPSFSSLPDIVPAETARVVARASARTGVRICAVSATFNLIHPASRDRGLALLPGLAEAAISLGCDLLTLCTGTRHETDMWTYHPDNHSPEAWADMIEGLRRASRIVHPYGIRLGIEPETANVVCDAASAEGALRELGPEGECFSIILDAANLYKPPIDPRTDPGIMDDAVARLEKRIDIAHAKDIADCDATAGVHDSNKHYTHVAAGTGILPYPHYLAALSNAPAVRERAKNGRRLPLILHGLEEGQVAASVAFLRESIATLAREEDKADALLSTR